MGKVDRKKALFFVALIVFLFFAGLELATRAYWSFRKQNIYFMFYGPRSYQDIAEQQVQIPFKYYGKYRKYLPGKFMITFPSPHTVIINSKGFRGKEFDRMESRGQLRIGCLGESSTASIECGEEGTYPYLLGRSLANAEVINFGIIGATSSSLLEMFRQEVSDYDLDICILYAGINNYIDLTSRILFDKGFAWNRVKEVLKNYSLFFTLLNEKIAGMRGDVNLAYQLPFNYYKEYTRNKKKYQERFDRVKKDFTGLVHIAKDKNIKMIFVTQAVNDRIYDQQAKEEISRKTTLSYNEFIFVLQKEVNKIIAEIARNENVILIDAAEEFDRIKSNDFFDLVHLKESGNRVLVKTIVPAITPLLNEKGDKRYGND